MDPSLIDPFGRSIDYLRLSVTDRCDLRCQYCLPAGFRDFEEPSEWLSFDEIAPLVRAFTELGVAALSLSTNAVQLARDAAALRHAGVSRLNVSLDSLRPERFASITGGGKLDRVLAGLEAARAAGFVPIKINM